MRQNWLRLHTQLGYKFCYCLGGLHKMFQQKGNINSSEGILYTKIPTRDNPICVCSSMTAQKSIFNHEFNWMGSKRRYEIKTFELVSPIWLKLSENRNSQRKKKKNTSFYSQKLVTMKHIRNNNANPKYLRE